MDDSLLLNVYEISAKYLPLSSLIVTNGETSNSHDVCDASLPIWCIDNVIIVADIRLMNRYD